MSGPSKIPDGLRYTKDHEWVETRSGGVVRIGITDHAQDALTDVVYVELPDEGEEFKPHDSMGVVESVKSVNDIFAPVAGRVRAANADLDKTPELMNQDPYGNGWFCELEGVDDKEVASLMDAAAYKAFLARH